MKKVITTAVIALTLVGLAGCGNKDPNMVDDGINRAVLIVEGDNTWEIRVESDNNSLISYVNGDKKEAIPGKWNEKELMELPSITGENDLLGMPLITEDVYDTDLDDSAMYINYLKNNGYTETRCAQTSEFIEYYFKKESEQSITCLRVIVTDDFTVSTQVDAELPEVNLNDYIFN